MRSHFINDTPKETQIAHIHRTDFKRVRCHMKINVCSHVHRRGIALVFVYLIFPTKPTKTVSISVFFSLCLPFSI